ncbi:MAG: hypothetical protein R3Y54_10210 [Eubacteriales bacterium]
MESQKLNIKFRILKCRTTLREPLCNKDFPNEKFLGFDYAYAGGSYYSCILNDLVLSDVKEFQKFKLNKNGLFDTETEVFNFIKCRESIATDTSVEFEKGDFIIYKLHEVDPLIFMI